MPEPDLDRLRAAGAQVALDYDEDLRPVPAGVTAPLFLCHIPKDVVAMRRRDPRAALHCRRALRDCLVGALEQGHRAAAITRSGWYVLGQKGTA